MDNSNTSLMVVPNFICFDDSNSDIKKIGATGATEFTTLNIALSTYENSLGTVGTFESLSVKAKSIYAELSKVARITATQESEGVCNIARTLNKHLTIKPLVAILSTLSPHVAVGILTPRKGAKTPLSLTVFLCSSFSINAGLIRAQFIMVDCFRGAFCPARSFAGSEKPNSVHRPIFLTKGSGTPSNKGVTVMSQNNSTKKTTIVLNPQTVEELVSLLSLAKTRAHELAQVPLYEQQQNAGLDFELAQVECPITEALAVLSKATHTETPFSKVPQTILDFSQEGLESLPNDYLAETVKDLGEYQDYCYQMAGLAEAAMVHIESILDSRVGNV